MDLPEVIYSDAQDPIARCGDPSKAELNDDPSRHASSKGNDSGHCNDAISICYPFSIHACFYSGSIDACYQFREHEHPRCEAWPEEDIKGLG